MSAVSSRTRGCRRVQTFRSAVMSYSKNGVGCNNNVYVGSAKQFGSWLEDRGFPKKRVDNKIHGNIHVFLRLRFRPLTKNEQAAAPYAKYADMVKQVTKASPLRRSRV